MERRDAAMNNAFLSRWLPRRLRCSPAVTDPAEFDSEFGDDPSECFLGRDGITRQRVKPRRPGQASSSGPPVTSVDSARYHSKPIHRQETRPR